MKIILDDENSQKLINLLERLQKIISLLILGYRISPEDLFIANETLRTTLKNLKK